VSEIVDRLAAAIARKDYGAVESVWLELLEAEAVPAEALGGLLGQLVAAGQGARALDLVQTLVPELLRVGRYAESLPLLRAVAPAAQGNEEVRTQLLTCYRHLYGKVPHLAPCLDLSGLLDGPDLAAACASLDRLLSYREGDYFYHAAGWGVGRIVAFDPLTARATIDFERRPGHQVPLETIESVFVRLPPDSFHVLRKTSPETLRQLAQDDPARLVRMVLAACDGRISLRGLRNALEGAVVPAEAWSKWWSSARVAVRRDPFVSIAAGSNPMLTLRTEALTYEEATQARFESVKDLVHQTQILAEYAEHKAQDADPEAFLVPAARTIAARIASEAQTSPGAAFEAALLLARLKLDAGPYPSPEEIVALHKADPIPLLTGLTSNATRQRAFQMLREASDNWPALCYQALLRGPEPLWEAAAGELPPSGPPPSIEALVNETLANPRRNLALFAWVCRSLLLGRWKTGVTTIQVFEDLLDEGNALARQKAQQRGEWTPFKQGEAIAQIRQSLRAGDLGYFDQMLLEISEAEAQRLLFRIRQSSVLPEHFARMLEQKMVRRFPKLLVEEEDHRGEAAPVEYIYATAEAIARRRAEHDHIVHVLIPKNSEDIARAKETGDVTDNADFRAAIQEQHVLNAKAIELGQELQRARPIEPAMVSSEHVSIGARVTIENTATGERQTLAILGPWDSDAEHGVIAYVAPLAQALLRHRVGEEVHFSHAGQEATYRIVELGSALEGRGNSMRDE